jgi:Na+-transporting methylmalonyl-CoA/oxaloacetate decarboxylase gamma subunit
LSVNGIDFGVVFLAVAIVLIVLLGLVLVYQIKLIRNISFLKAHAKESKEEPQEAQDPVLAAVIIAAINQYKNQNLQR